MSAFSYMGQNAYYRDLKCIFEDVTMLLLRNKGPIIEQFAREFCNLPLQAKKRIK